MYVTENLWQELPKANAGFGQVNVEKLFPDQILPSRMNPVGRWGPVVGRYSLVKPQRIMWETPVSSPTSTDKVEEHSSADRSLSGFGVQPLPKATTGVILGALLGVGLVIAVAVVALQEDR